MSLRETKTPSPDEDAGPPTGADARMADLLSDKSRAAAAREDLRKEGSDEADDLLGRLNAMDFIDTVLGEDYDLPGKIGDFEITSVLGRGGMGTVYKAYQETLDREVALKVLAPRFSSDVTMRKRFRTEAKATAAMHHQHIVPIYGYGEASGHLFFAMELVQGVSLDKHITVARRKNRGAMEPLEAARRFAGVADALALAHKRQILHRDVKPGNLLVHDDGTLALADFGLSKFLGEVSQHLTSVGGFLGTLHYAPPEQARGEELGPASDFYSLGVTLFECVTGRLPLLGDSTEAMLQALLNDEPMRLRSVMPKAPKDLDAVLEKLLQKDPRDRYQDGENLALDLIRIAEGEPVRIRRQDIVTRIYRRAKRNPMMTAAVGAALVVLVMTALFLQSLSENKSINRASRGRDFLAEAGFEAARDPGDALGPFGLLNALTGAPLSEPARSSRFLAKLEAAVVLLPAAASQVLRYRSSYQGKALRRGRMSSADPVESLKAGNGADARATITESILKIGRELNTYDLGVRIDLYNLYLARALANLSASVGDTQSALLDLEIAAFIQSGAFLPKMLREFLVWSERTRPELLIDRLKLFVQKGAVQKAATAQFLLAFAGICPPSGSHLMRFPMSYATRITLCMKAMEWLGDNVQKGVAGGYYGLEFQLAELAAKVLENAGDQPVRDAALQSARSLLIGSVENSSPLQSWQHTFDLLDTSETSPTTRRMDPAVELCGAIHYVRLVQTRLSIDQADAQLREFEPRVESLLDEAIGNGNFGVIREDSARSLAVELKARLYSWVADPKVAEEATAAWLKLDGRNPEATLCRFCTLVRAVPKSDSEWYEAFLAGTEAGRNSLDESGIRRRLVARIQSQKNRVESTGGKAPQLEKLLGNFGPDPDKGGV